MLTQREFGQAVIIRPDRRPMSPGAFVLLALALFLVLELVARAWSLPGPAGQVAESLLLYTAIPVVVIRAAGRGEWLSLRVDQQILRYAAVVAVLVLPVYVFGALFVGSIRAYYPPWPVEVRVGGIAEHAAVILALMLGTEVMFRGLLLLALREVGPLIVLLHVIPYTLLHIGKPPPEVLSSFFAALIWGWADYRCGSLFPSLLTHTLGMFVMDLLIVLTPGLGPGLW